MTRVETRPVLGCTMSLVRTPEAVRRALDELGLFGHVEGVPQHHREGEDAGERVGDVFAGDVRRAAVDRFIERLAPAGCIGRAPGMTSWLPNLSLVWRGILLAVVRSVTDT